MEEETSVLSQKKPIFRTSQNCKVVINNTLFNTRGGGDSILELFNWIFPMYFAQAEEWDGVGCIIAK